MANYNLQDYKDFQVCGSQTSSLNLEYYIGVSRNPFQCPAVIDWYKAGKDFEITEIGENNLSGETSDLEIAGSSYSNVKVDKITHELSVSIKPNLNSKLWQRLMEIQATDSVGNYNGKYILSYLNGGFHLLVKIKPTDGQQDFNVNKVYTNLVTTQIPDDLLQNWSDNELSAELSFQNTHQPHYDLLGLPDGFGISSDIKNAPEVMENLSVIKTGTTSSIAGTVGIKDVDGLAYNTKARVVVMDDNFNPITETVVDNAVKGSPTGVSWNVDGTFETGKKYYASYGWYVNENLTIQKTDLRSKTI